MLVVDCETDKSLLEAGYSHQPAFHRSAAEQAFEYHCALRQLRPTVAVSYDTDQCQLYVSVPNFENEGPDENWQFDVPGYDAIVERGFEDLTARLQEATAICGWNVAFDLNVLSGVCGDGERANLLSAWTPKALDPMLSLAKHTNRYLSLQDAVKLNQLCGGEAKDPKALQHTYHLLKKQWAHGKNANGLQAIQMHRQARWTELVEYCCVDVLLTAQLALREKVNVPVAINLHKTERPKKQTSCQTPAYWTQTTRPK